jgi:small conductance mechanosensitive channel
MCLFSETHSGNCRRAAPPVPLLASPPGVGVGAGLGAGAGAGAGAGPGAGLGAG